MAVLVGVLVECVLLSAVLPSVALLPVLSVLAAHFIDPTIQPWYAGLAGFVVGCMLALPVLLVKQGKNK